MTRPINFSIALKAMLFFLLLAEGRSGAAADYTVEMTPFLRFEPDTLQIQAGDTVIWTNEDTVNQHDTVSTQDYWVSPLLDFGQTYSLVFPVTGEFPYQDSFFGEDGMTGTVVVIPAIPVPVLIQPTLLPSGTFQLIVTNLAIGETNLVQSSANLSAWSAIYTNVASGSAYTYVDPVAIRTTRAKFYRVLVPP